MSRISLGTTASHRGLRRAGTAGSTRSLCGSGLASRCNIHGSERSTSRSLRKPTAFAVCLALVLACGVGGLFAWLHDDTPAVPNTFTPGSVTCQVQENFNGALKSDVRVENTGNVPAFMRATIVVTWVDGDGAVSATAPEAGADYALSLADDGWTQGADGFYYYAGAVDPGEETGVLIDGLCPVGAGPEGYTLRADVLADAVQAEGGTAQASAVELAWGADAAALVLGTAAGRE